VRRKFSEITTRAIRNNGCW